MSRDPRIDGYIEKARPFARPILEHLRQLVHAAVPDAGEAIKWGMPHFTYKGKNVAGMAAFKAHCAFMIHGEGRQGEGVANDSAGMGSFGRIAGLDDLPADKDLQAKLKTAMERIDAGGRAANRAASPASKAEIPVPQDFAAALRDTPAANATFDRLTPSQRREYLEWITGAKRDETRAKRVATALEWLAEGKRRNWKYEKR